MVWAAFRFVIFTQPVGGDSSSRGLWRFRRFDAFACGGGAFAAPTGCAGFDEIALGDSAAC
jgi:hypothetical protein